MLGTIIAASFSSRNGRAKVEPKREQLVFSLNEALWKLCSSHTPIWPFSIAVHETALHLLGVPK
ncbi:hypothetical protein CCGE531_08815 [Rhizobium sp. CCGE531]|nr:hypothetical protein CCGE531_08815 [Rhizobium sp. CCGE531]